jgi:hypothetical protein
MKSGLIFFSIFSLTSAYGMDLSGVRESTNIQDRRSNPSRWELIDFDCQMGERECTGWIEVDAGNLSIPVDVIYVEERGFQVSIKHYHSVRPINSERVCATIAQGAQLRSETFLEARGIRVIHQNVECAFKLSWSATLLGRMNEVLSGAVRSVQRLGERDGERSGGKDTNERGFTLPGPSASSR